MLFESVKNIVSLSIPNPHPPVGGNPYSKAVQKFSSTYIASSSPASLSCNEYNHTYWTIHIKLFFSLEVVLLGVLERQLSNSSHLSHCWKQLRIREFVVNIQNTDSSSRVQMLTSFNITYSYQRQKLCFHPDCVENPSTKSKFWYHLNSSKKGLSWKFFMILVYNG